MKFIISILAVFAAFLAQSGAFSVRNGMRMSLTGNCLIVQNKGGGHGTIGYYLCNELLAKNPDLKISMLQDKCNYKKVPFSLYDELKDKGVEIIDTDMSTNPDVGGKKFDYVVDNWSKGAEAASYMINLVKSCEAKQYVFVSSAGMYKSNDGTPLTESDDVKVNAVREVEEAVVAEGLPYTFLRPQYIYSTKSNKRYLDYFISRAARKLPVPVPNKGDQFVCLTHTEDVASLIAAAVGNEKATNEIFNCGTDKYVSYEALAKLAYKETVGGDADIVTYDPKEFPDAMDEFPFRAETFVTTPNKAKAALGWAPKHTVEEDFAVEVADYKAMGGMDSDFTSKGDAAVIEAKKASV